MLRKIVVLLIVVSMYFTNAHAENNYPYKDKCPNGGIITQCVDTDYDGVFDNSPCEYQSESGYFVDRWLFAQCNCTSFSAHKVDDQLDGLTEGEIRFSNSYLNQHWGDGKNWDNAARATGIKVDSRN